MLDARTASLIAVGASVTAHCQPCLEANTARAAKHGAGQSEIAGAVAVGRTRFRREGVNCLDCHMPRVEAPAVTGGPPRSRRSHRFPADKDEAMLARALNAALEVTPEGRARFRITRRPRHGAGDRHLSRLDEGQAHDRELRGELLMADPIPAAALGAGRRSRMVGESTSVSNAAIDFAHVYEAYHGEVLAYAARLVGRDDAADVAQEVFLKVSRSLDTLADPERLSSWIHAITLNTARDKARARAARPPRSTPRPGSPAPPTPAAPRRRRPLAARWSPATSTT